MVFMDEKVLFQGKDMLFMLTKIAKYSVMLSFCGKIKK